MSEKEEAERKTKEAAKKLDYLVRAIRIEELPLIKKKYEEKTKLDKERYEQENIKKVRKAKAQWEADVKDKALLEELSVFAYFSQFEEVVMRGRKAEYKGYKARGTRPNGNQKVRRASPRLAIHDPK